ncbi:alpha/beta hydrolase [Brevibacillus sp. TJ4]|uniref:alpha/beta hydrolase n=1 Tax=Brevibacillus sp. TJ4 TaxID=3234853 RepID=UPI003BA28D8F
MERTLQIESGSSTLTATLHEPKTAAGDDTGHPLVLICHGFVGSRIGVNRLFVKAARELASHGLAVLRFDYGGCGESEGEYGAGGLDVLLRQTRDVVDFATRLEQIDPTRIILLGHSLGGAVATLAASQDERIRSLVLWAAVARPQTDIVQIVGQQGYVQAQQTGRTDYLGYTLTERFFHSLGLFDPLREARKFSGDVLLLHGNRDDVIALDAMFQYERQFRLRQEGSCETGIVLGGDHTFSSEEGYNRLMASTVAWVSSQMEQLTVTV